MYYGLVPIQAPFQSLVLLFQGRDLFRHALVSFFLLNRSNTTRNFTVTNFTSITSISQYSNWNRINALASISLKTLVVLKQEGIIQGIRVREVYLLNTHVSELRVRRMCVFEGR